MLLAYDHGLEHGPKNFNRRTADPENILNLALEGDYSGIVLQPGVAEKYYMGPYKDVPLVLKLNGQTDLAHLNPVSRQYCSVERAMKLGADAIGYTIYDGSSAEAEMFQEFGEIVDKAHDYGIPVIAWMYPKGPEVHDETSTDNIAYAARIALELGADFVKIKYNQDNQGFPWIVRSAGKCRVLLSGGEKRDDHTVLEAVKAAMDAGATGISMGRNVWQHPKPYSMTKALKDIVYRGKTVQEAIQRVT